VAASKVDEEESNGCVSRTLWQVSNICYHSDKVLDWTDGGRLRQIFREDGHHLTSTRQQAVTVLMVFIGQNLDESRPAMYVPISSPYPLCYQLKSGLCIYGWLQIVYDRPHIYDISLAVTTTAALTYTVRKRSLVRVLLSIVYDWWLRTALCPPNCRVSSGSTVDVTVSPDWRVRIALMFSSVRAAIIE
jgi:hypothetical protein